MDNHVVFGSGRGIRTPDLQDMNLTSCLAAPSRDSCSIRL